MTQRSNSDLYQAVHEALKKYHKPNVGESPFADLALYQLALNRPATTPHQATNYVLEQAMDPLRQAEPHEEQLLHMRYMDRQSVQKVCNTLNLSESAVQTKQREAIKDVVLILQEQEKNALNDQRHRLESRLEPISNFNVVGIDNQVEQLVDFVHPSKPPWIISIEGLGGIGKTTLADTLMRRVIESNLYHEIGWISAKIERLSTGGAITKLKPDALTTVRFVEQLAQHLFPDLFSSISNDSPQLHERLHRHLKEVPHLIVVDNLETVADVELLVPTLQNFANPTKFVLTSRHQVDGQAAVCRVSVRELSKRDTRNMIRKEAELSNLPALAGSSDENLQPIYDLVGGHPLALRLIVGQTHIHPLDIVLANLEIARGESAQNLYTFIYRNAWESLDEAARRVFLATVFLSPKGDDIEQLAGISGIETDTIIRALNKLVCQNLVDALGDYRERIYRIHSLTRTFLRDDIGKW